MTRAKKKRSGPGLLHAARHNAMVSEALARRSEIAIAMAVVCAEKILRAVLTKPERDREDETRL